MYTKSNFIFVNKIILYFIVLFLNICFFNDLGLSDIAKTVMMIVLGVLNLLWFTKTETVVHSVAMGMIICALAFCNILFNYESSVFEYKGKLFSPQSIHEKFAYLPKSTHELNTLKITNTYSSTKIKEIVKHHLLNDPEKAKSFIKHRFFDEPIKYLVVDKRGEPTLSEVDKTFLDMVDSSIIESTLLDACRRAQSFNIYNKIAAKYILKKHYKVNDTCHEFLMKDTGIIDEK